MLGEGGNEIWIAFTIKFPSSLVRFFDLYIFVSKLLGWVHVKDASQSLRYVRTLNQTFGEAEAMPWSEAN